MADDGLGDALARTEPPRDRWGRVLLPGPDGDNRAYTRATTLAGALSGPKPGLVNWKIRLAMHGVVANRTLHNLVAVTPLAERETLDDIARRALEYAGANDGASKGSTLHAACARARVVPGSFDTLPDDLKADVMAYAKCVTEAGIELDVDLIERMVVNDTVCSAGSFDDLVTVAGLPGRYVFDLKTGQDLSYSDAQDEIEIQLAVYANADAMVPKHWHGPRGRAQLEAMPEGISKRWAIVAHLPAGSATCTLHWVDIRRGWERAKLAFEARRKGTGFVAWGTPGMPTAEVPTGVDDLVQEVPATVSATDDAVAAGASAPWAPGEREAISTAAEEKPKRRRRTKAEIEADRLAAELARATGDDVVVPPTTPEASDGTFHPDGTFTPYAPDRFGDESRPDPVGPSAFTELAGTLASSAHAVGDTVAVGGIVFTKIGNDPFPPPLPAGSLARNVDDEPDPTAGARPDVSDAALDRTLAERDREARDAILAERKRIRVDAEIRAAIDDATKGPTPQAKAQAELATAWELWKSDWTEGHTAYATARLAACPPF